MRLTLRTMLAYLDDVLDPADAHELEQKIEESSFASGLVHRVRDSMRRMRLGAPKLEGRGLGADPNTVADYLDSTLPPERVPEFEKVCLESDVHLAEVASCHQILTLVLGQPAQVDASMRERIYRIGHPSNLQSDQPTAVPANERGNVSAANGAATYAAAQSAPRSRPAKSQRTSQLSIKSLAITLLLGFLLALVALQAIGVDRIRGMVGLTPARKVASRTTPSVQGSDKPQVSIPSGNMSTTSQVEVPESESLGSAIAPSDAPLPAASASNALPPSALRPDTGSANGSTADAPEAALPPASDASMSPDSAVVSRPLLGVSEVAPVGEPGPPAEIAAGEVAKPTMDSTTSTGDVAATEPTRQTSVGTYISEEHVLARFDETVNDWFRVPADAPLSAGQRVIALPAYRPQLLLVPNIKVTLAGESHVQFGTSSELAGPSLTVEAGRATIVPLGDPKAVLRLEVGERSGVVSFGDAESVAAVEVLRFLPPGQKPELAPAIQIVQLFAQSGQVAWEEGGDRLAVNAGQVLVIGGSAAPQLFEAGELPAWVSGKELAEIDRLAATELRDDLTVDRPLSLSLLERTEFRRVEVASLACRSLCSLGMFDSSIEALNGERLRSYWYVQFNALRGAMARNPEAAIQVQRSLEKLAGDDADLMYELLCGFNPDQLVAGGARELVDALEHERVAVRVLAYENLRRITDRTQLFRPEKLPALQKGAVAKWRQNLADGEIVYLHPPQALPPRRPATERRTAPVGGADAVVED